MHHNAFHSLTYQWYQSLHYHTSISVPVCYHIIPGSLSTLNAIPCTLIRKIYNTLWFYFLFDILSKCVHWMKWNIAPNSLWDATDCGRYYLYPLSAWLIFLPIKWSYFCLKLCTALPYFSPTNIPSDMLIELKQ